MCHYNLQGNIWTNSYTKMLSILVEQAPRARKFGQIGLKEVTIEMVVFAVSSLKYFGTQEKQENVSMSYLNFSNRQEVLTREKNAF